MYLKNLGDIYFNTYYEISIHMNIMHIYIFLLHIYILISMGRLLSSQKQNLNAT